MALAAKHAQHTAHTGCAADRAVLQLNMSLAHAQRRADVDMPRQQLKLAVDGAAGYLRDRAIKCNAVRRHDLERESCHTPTALLLLGLGQDIINRTSEQETALGDAVTLAVQNHLEATQGLLQRHILTGHTGKLLRNMERL